MKIKDGFILREIVSSNIVVPVGDAQFSMSGVMTLNDVGAFLWKVLEKGDATEDELVSAVCGEYDIDEETARADIQRYIKKLRLNNIIED